MPAAHSEWLAHRVPSAELWLRPDDGHISILDHSPAALGWLREHAEGRLAPTGPASYGPLSFHLSKAG